MTSKKIYLIRHGQTDYNLKGIVQGSGVDASLNETGRKQAAAFYQKYKDVPFKKIYTSVLKRSIETVQGFIDQGIPWEKYAGLNEISWGSRDGKIVSQEDNEYYKNMVGAWRSGNVDLRPEGGESPREVEQRIRKVMDIIVPREEEDVILVCMHGRALRILLASMIRQDLSAMDDFMHNNLCLYILDVKGGQFFIEKANDLEHLGNSIC